MYGALTPWAILDADGAVLDDDREMWDELDNGANVPTLISNLSDDGGDWSEHKTFLNAHDRLTFNRPCLDLKTASGITTEQSARPPACRTSTPASGGVVERGQWTGQRFTGG